MKSFEILFVLLVAGCSEQEPVGVVSPMTMNEEAVGHYCQMNVLDHDGPKAQVHLEGVRFPIWFVQIRDAFAFERMPEQSEPIVAIYVNDMGAPDAKWEAPGDDNWIRAADAFYVVDSEKRGGMSAPDFIPFAHREDARAFTLTHGGSVIAYDEITDAAVLTPVDVELDLEAEPTDENGS